MSFRFLAFLSPIIFTACGFAQELTISDISLSGSWADGDYSTPIIGSGFGIVSGSQVGVIVNGSTTRDRDLGCRDADVIQLPMTFTFASGDTLSIVVTVSSKAEASPFTLNGAFYVTGGTGSYAGKGGSGTITLTISVEGHAGGGSSEGNSGTFTVTGSLTGTLSAQLAPPVISPSGVVPIYSEVPVIQPGSWISVYGQNLAAATATWDGSFPTTLAGTSVKVAGVPAYLSYVSPTLINLQVPDIDPAPGCVGVEINSPNCTTSYAVAVQRQAPSFNLVTDGQDLYAIGIINTATGADALYPFAYPGLTTRSARPGETISLFGVGFGPARTPLPAGQASGPREPDSILEGLEVTIGGRTAPASAYLIGQGIYQLNITLPAGLSSGKQLVRARLFPGTAHIFEDNTTTQVHVPVYVAVQ